MIRYKKEIENIFVKSETRKKNKTESIPKEKIIIDYREKNCFVASFLIKNNFPIEWRELKVGDYIVNDTIIERKEITDFLHSMKNKRLINQIGDLQQYEKKLILIEGIEEKELYNDYNQKGIHANAVRGFLLSIALKHKIPLIFTKNAYDTAKFISVLSKKKETTTSLVLNKKPKTKQETKQFIIEGFPGIGPKNAKKLLEEFGSLKNLFNASEEELETTLGKKSEIITKIISELY